VGDRDFDDAAALPWDLVDVVVPNEAEARALLQGALAGSERRTAGGLADALAVDLGVSVVVVTLGEAGCLAHFEGGTWRYPAEKAEAVDATGAGDAFMAAFAARLVGGAPVPDAIEAAQSAAAWAVRHPGGHEAMPGAAQVDRQAAGAAAGGGQRC